MLTLFLLPLVRGPLPWLQLCPAARGWEQNRPGPISCCSCCTSSQSPRAKTGMGPNRQGVWHCAEGERWGRPVGICSPKTGLSPQSWAWNWGVEGRKNTPRKGWFQNQVSVCSLVESAREEQLSPVPQGRKEVRSAADPHPPNPIQSWSLKTLKNYALSDKYRSVHMAHLHKRPFARPDQVLWMVKQVPERLRGLGCLL